MSGLYLGPLVLIYIGLSVVSMLAQGGPQTGIVPLVSTDPVSEYLTRGGAFGVIGLLLYFYRRDYSKALDFSKEYTETLAKIVADSTRAQTENAISAAASTRAVEASTTALSANTAALQRILDRLDRATVKAV